MLALFICQELITSKMQKINLILIIGFLLLVPFSYANTDYNMSGGVNNYYQTGTGFFNTEVTATTYSRTVGVQRNTPLVADLDGNGNNEIIILDGDSIELYRNKELDIVDSIDLGADQNSNMIVFDIDGDNLTEIIVAQEVSQTIKIVEYNGTNIINQTDLDFSALDHLASSYVAIRCRDVNDCLIAYNNKISKSHGGGTAGEIHVAFFNSTAVINEVNLDTIGAGTSIHCLPTIRHIALADFDVDGDKDYIFTTIEVESGGVESVDIFYVDVASQTPSEVLQIDDTEIVGVTETDAGCGAYDHLFTSPLVAELDGSLGNGLETVIGTQTDDDEYNLKVYDSGGNLEEQHPLLADADGILVSNVMLADVFPDSDNTDYCVVGYQTVTEEIDLLCGSLQDTFVSQNELEFSMDVPYNISEGDAIWNPISHMGQHSSETQEGKNIQELINSYGVSRLDLDDCSVIGLGADCTLEVIFENPVGDSVLIPVDAEKVTAVGGREDLIALSSTNLFYIDDGFSNSAGEITSYTVNPCIDSTWKINTSVTITTIVEDDDLDTVSSKVILYEGDSNEQDSGFTDNVSSGTTNSFSFVANKTMGTGAIKLVGRDSENLDTLDEIDLTFSVSSNGLEFGDCITEVSIAPEEEEEDEIVTVATLTVDASENSITSGINTVMNLTGLAGTTFWLFLMLAFSIGLYFRGASIGWSGNGIVGAIAIVNLLFLVIGARVGLISTALIVILVVISVVILGVFLGRFLTGLGTSGE